MFNLAQALEAVKNKPEFSVNARYFGTVIDYNVTMKDTFVGRTPEESTILRNLRGTCFDHSGKIIRLAFHKFENLGQSEDYMPENFDFSAPHRIEQKLDGSMIAPIPYDNGTIRSYRLGTRAGVTDVAAMAEHFFQAWMPYAQYLSYDGFIRRCLQANWTPMFEYCSRENRVVIDHPESKLVLIGIRENSTGRYLDTHGVAIDPLIEKVKIVRTESSDITKFAEYIKTLKDDEGVVVKFSDGRYVKIKADEYCLRHRTLDGLRFEKDVLKMVLTGVLDDVLPLVQPDVKDRLVAYNDSVWQNIRGNTAALNTLYESVCVVPTKKEFAQLVNKSPYRAALFKLYDGKKFDFAEFALTKTGSSSDVESIRWLIGKSYFEF